VKILYLLKSHIFWRLVLLAELCRFASWFCQMAIAQGDWAELGRIATKGVGLYIPLNGCIVPIFTKFGTKL